MVYTYIVGQYMFQLRSFLGKYLEGGAKHNVDPLETAKEIMKETV